MKQLKILKLLTNGKYILIALIASIIMLVVYPVIQTLPQGLNNLDLWFKIIPPFNFVLYVLFSLIFGILLSLQIFNFYETRSCGIKSTSSGLFGIVGGFIVTQCPACLSLASFILPLGATSFLVTYNVYFMLGSLFLMVLGIYFLGGFKKI